MTNKSRYVFGAALAGIALSGIPGLSHQANGAVITTADFTFEGLTASGSTAGGASFGSYSADSGVGTAYGVHALAAAAYSEPAGNGSLKSFSSNQWSIGDYYQFSVPTTGLSAIQIAFDQIGSNTGPAQFELFASADGTSFSSVGAYTIVLGTGTTPTGWNPTTSVGFYNHAFDLSGFTSLNGDAGAVFRISDVGTAAINGSSAGVGTGGTDRVDNFVVSGTAVPEPASLTLLTVASAGLITRRRKQK